MLSYFPASVNSPIQFSLISIPACYPNTFWIQSCFFWQPPAQSKLPAVLPSRLHGNLLQLSLLSLVLFYILCFEQSCSTELMFNTPRLKPSKLELTVFSISSDCLSHILRGSTAFNACLPLEFFSNVNYDDTQCRHFGQLISWTH